MKSKVVFDIECYRNYFCVAFRNIDNDKSVVLELYKGHPLDTQRILKIIRNHTLISFNGINYDVPMLSLSLKQGVTNDDLKRVSDAIIVHGKKPWDIERDYQTPKLTWLDHIDLIEVAPGQASLKIYGGRLHSKRMQDLPIEPNDLISPEDRLILSSYCLNDLQTTIDLYNDLKGELALRYAMTDDYGVDVRSKSDAQIAEAILVKEIEQLRGEKIYRPEYENSYKFSYDPPSFIKFKTPNMVEFFNKVKNAKYGFSEKDKVTIPTELKGSKIKLGNSVYTFGNGGLHSNEKSKSHVSDHKFKLWDWDVASYYPSIVLECKLSPEQLGDHFFSVYSGFKAKRLIAKANKNKVMDSGLKIFLNSSFGKLGSKWSRLYAPKLMIQVTVTGQLALLMLIEELELNGIPVVSGNTDGIVIKCPVKREDDMKSIIAKWEKTTKFVMESANYRAIYARDVNDYIAIKDDGSVKQKGAYAFVGSKGKEIEKNPANYICIDAVINYLTKGIPVDETIEWNWDIRRFITIRQVNGGGMKDGVFLGKAVRWYYAKGEQGYIEYKTNGKKVGNSDGAKPLMVLPDLFPNDIDYEKYNKEAIDMLYDLGALL